MEAVIIATQSGIGRPIAIGAFVVLMLLYLSIYEKLKKA